MGASSHSKDDMQLKTPRADVSFANGNSGDLTPRIFKEKEKRKVADEKKRKVRRHDFQSLGL